MKCPTCGKPDYEPPTKGRPKQLNDAKIRKLKQGGASLADLAAKFGVTRGAIQAALKRAK